MDFYTVFENPSEYPGKFVVRRMEMKKNEDGVFVATYDAEPLAVSDLLPEAISSIPSHCYNIGRMNNDDPCILEVWL